jgi:hypothetical protein
MPIFLATLEAEVQGSRPDFVLGKSARLYLKTKLKTRKAYCVCMTCMMLAFSGVWVPLVLLMKPHTPGCPP